MPDPATPRQIDYLNDLLLNQNLAASPKFYAATNAMDADELTVYIATIRGRAAADKTLCSRMIDALKVLPKLEGALKSSPDHETRLVVAYSEIELDNGKTKRVGRIGGVLAGSYGLNTERWSEFSNDFSFFRLWIGDRGGWNIKLYVSDDLDRVDLGRGTQYKVLKAIQDAGPAAASAAFGRETSRCGVCARRLTNDDSRARGIGPVCARSL